LKKRLDNSVYPTQARDFFFLTLPKGHPDEGKEVPVDALLKNLVLFFWERNFITMGWDEGNEVLAMNKKCELYKEAFISFDVKMTTGEYTLSPLKRLLRELIGKENIFILDETKKKFHGNTEFSKHRDKLVKKVLEFLNKNPQKILIAIHNHFIAILFRPKNIKWLSEKFNIEKPNFEDRYPGIFTRNLKSY